MQIHVIADSSGETAARLARAAQAQFPATSFSIVRHPRVKDSDALLGVFDAISGALEASGGCRLVVLYTLVKEPMAGMVERYCADKQIPHADLFRDTLRAFEDATGTEPDGAVARPVGVEADYFDRISAMEFAVRNDDGVMPGALHECDICLVGASRSGKTPLSLYLGYVGYKTVNVPLVPGIAPPPELFRIDRWRIVGLTIDAERLLQIRNRRAKSLGGYGTKDGGYADLVKIYDELDEVGRIQRSLGCPVIDTTGLALEEAASRVTEIVEQRARRAGTHLRRPAGSMKIAP
ncbi:pyruvate, water dikinase regulatory protein [Brooklawnia cerclae]